MIQLCDKNNKYIWSGYRNNSVTVSHIDEGKFGSLKLFADVVQAVEFAHCQGVDYVEQALQMLGRPSRAGTVREYTFVGKDAKELAANWGLGAYA